jgi:thiol-disulfide isomerase/thioredoxin
MRIIPLIFLCFTLSRCSGSKEKPVEITDSTEPMGIPKMLERNGKPVDFERFNGKIIIVNLWATWCMPCIKEMPDLFALTKKLPADKFELLLATDQSMKTIDKFVTKRGLKLHYVQLQNSIESLGVYALPTTLIYDRSGKEIHRLLGDRAWTSEKTLLFFKNMLPERGSKK